MAFSSAQTWVIIAIVVVIALGIIGSLSGKKETPKSPPARAQTPTAAAQAGIVAALATHASRFDREMYIDDMTPEQLEHEHVWRTAYITGYNIVGNLGPDKDNPFETICTAITGHPADRQLAGLTEYFYETVYEPMLVDAEDRYWDDELIARKDQWSDARREQILLAALIPLQMADELHTAIRGRPASEDDLAKHLIPYIDRVGEAFFGADTAERMSMLREQAKGYASAIEF
ncbi:hypothetical protein K1X12_10320 [Hyphomonas sp. WL0036]|uniref:hypothetical protein n=1 Tax=Hyphomonas sediminis TaxID=2866160 RepID=UPI001C7F8DE2|nr:hypothetical protein [Hyphomonas sediminis]MBY9067296.1 hypothetical protein [Hyphomonas sediminis]